MSIEKETKSGKGQTGFAEADVDNAAEEQGHRKMTLADNVILTIKVLAGFGLMGVALWGISLWKAAS